MVDLFLFHFFTIPSFSLSQEIIQHTRIVEQEQKSNDDPAYHNIELAKFFSEHETSPRLTVFSKHLTDQDMKIVANTLRSNKVREQSFVIENYEIENCRKVYVLLFFIFCPGISRYVLG